MRRGLLAARHAQLFCLGLMVAVGGACAPELEKFDEERSKRASLGREVYKTMCRRVAGTELPEDLDGRESEELCLGDDKAAAAALKSQRSKLPARLVALAERRERIVKAVDMTLPTEAIGEELENLMRKLLPFYDPPEERIQKSTRSLAAFLEKLDDDKEALLGLERLGRSGMSPPAYSYGVYRAMLGYEDVSKVLSVLLPILSEDKDVKPSFELMLKGLALELATSKVDNDPDSDTRVLKDLLTRTFPEFGDAKDALYTTVRDARGLPTPSTVAGEAVPYPFIDKDGDDLADEKDGQFVLAPNYGGPLPDPFATRDESADISRDEFGRARGFDSAGVTRDKPLFQSLDANRTVLGAAMRESGKLFDPKSKIAIKLAKVFPVLFGDPVETSKDYVKLSFGYDAPDTEDSPIIDTVYALASTVDRSIYPESLELTRLLVDQYETEWAQSMEPLLALEKRTRPGSDAYPTAKLADKTIFWDELLYESEKLSRMRRAADGVTALEALMRGTLGYERERDANGEPLETLERVADFEKLKHQGAVAATLMRFKDEWRSNPNSESKREEGDPAVLGGFNTPVDRTKPDAPVTCGKDGCGGLIKGTLFEPWATKDAQGKVNQICMVQRGGRVGKDCGAPANQSIYHRSLGLIYEMAGRSQCNKVITVGNLLDSALFKDPCANPKPPVTDCVGADAAAKDTFCATGLGVDYECDDKKDICVVKRNSPTCSALRTDQQNERKQTILDTESALQKSYTCSPDPNDKCFEGKYPAAFVDLDGPGVGQESAIRACDMMNLPDVGRTFGRALSHEFTIDVPNPWVFRYLTDIARARAPESEIPTCEDYSIRPSEGDDPRDTPTCSEPGDPCPIGRECIPNAARLSREVYAEDIAVYEARYKTEVDTLGELIEFLLDDRSLFQNDKDTADLRPDVKALSRVLFAPAGSSSFLVFDPLLIQGAPQGCTQDLLDAGIKACPLDDTLEETKDCCLSDLTKPPLRYRLDTYYGATTFAWEHDLTFTDGTKLSFIDATKALADAINRVDFRPASVVDPEGDPGDVATQFESTDYVFSTLGKIIAQHYDSPANPQAQDKDPKKPTFRHLTNLVSYEEMIADLLDDGMIVDEGDDFITLDGFTKPEQHLGLLYKSFGALEALTAMDFGPDRDGIDVAADLTEHLLSPHRGCAGPSGDPRIVDGKGACDLQVAGDPDLVAPVTYRDGHNTICWNDGRCFDGLMGEPTRYASPIYMLLDSVKKIDDRIVADPKVDEAFDAARASLIDTYVAIEDGKLKDRLMRGLLIVGAEFMRDRWLSQSKAGKLSDLREQLTSDTVDLVSSPVFAAGLDMLEALLDKPDALDELTAFSYALLTDAEGKDNLRSLLSAFADLIQALPGDRNTNALLRVLSESMVPGIGKVVASGKGKLDLEASVLWQNLTLSRDTVEMDAKNVLPKVFNNLVASSEELPYTPLETFIDAVTAINRADPKQKGVLSAADWGAVAKRLSEVMRDERRGLERLYDLVQCRNGGEDSVCE